MWSLLTTVIWNITPCVVVDRYHLFRRNLPSAPSELNCRRGRFCHIWAGGGGFHGGMNVVVFRDVTSCNLVEYNLRFGGTSVKFYETKPALPRCW